MARNILFSALVLICVGIGSYFGVKAAGVLVYQHSYERTPYADHSEYHEYGEKEQTWRAWADDVIEWTVHDAAGFYTFILCVVTFLLVIGTGVLGYITFLLWKAAADQGEDTRRSIAAVENYAVSMNKMAQHTERHAIATESGTAANTRTMEIVQRAFISINVFDTSTVNKIVWIMPKWMNSGTTAANPVQCWSNWYYFPGKPPTDYRFPDLNTVGSEVGPDEPGITTFLAPHGTFIGDIIKIPVDKLELATDGHGKIIIWGWCKYTDIFSATHKTEFCNEVNITRISKDEETGKTIAAVVFTMYGSRNTAD